MTAPVPEDPPLPFPPRVIVVMPAQWPRALLRAALREVGYDAVGARTLGEALRVRAAEPDRGAVRLILVDQPALGGVGGEAQLAQLLTRHGEPATLLIASATVAAAGGPWRQVLQRPVSIADIVDAVAALLPLALAARHPVD